MKQINSDVTKKTLHESKKGGFPEENKFLYSIPVTLSHIQDSDGNPSISGHCGNDDHPFFVNDDDNVHSVSVDGDSIDIQPLPVDGDDENNGHSFSIGNDSDDHDHSYSVNGSDFEFFW